MSSSLPRVVEYIADALFYRLELFYEHPPCHFFAQPPGSNNFDPILAALYVCPSRLAFAGTPFERR